MKFEQLPVALSEGRILAHSFISDQFKRSKGCCIDKELIDQMVAAGGGNISTVALDWNEINERDAALDIAESLAGSGVYLDLKASGAVDLRASEDGIVLLDEVIINQCNLLMRTATIATRAALCTVSKGDRVATIKVIPYGVKKDVITAVCRLLEDSDDVIRVAEFKALKVGLIQTESVLQRDPLFDKTQKVIEQRLKPLKSELDSVIRCSHSAEDIKDALIRMKQNFPDLIVIVGPTAIVDEEDLIPASICAIGGRIEHYGMPVEPGHMLLLAYTETVPIIGAPTCIRSPRDNGFDLLLKRFSVGLPVSGVDIMQMGVGGLLC